MKNRINFYKEQIETLENTLKNNSYDKYHQNYLLEQIYKLKDKIKKLEE